MPIDLRKHAVLEASAGTGKTHTIGELVLRLLKEENAALDEILIVTYTEKATGELKGRLRSCLEKELAGSVEPNQRDRLRQAIDRFDQAWIFTLHGFCRRILQEFPLEQGQDAGSQLVDDEELLQRCQREVQRRDWRREYQDSLLEVLEMSGYNRQQAQTWEEQVRELAAKFRPGSDQRLEPAPITNWPQTLNALRPAILAALPQLDSLLQQFALSPGGEFIRAHSHIKGWLQDPAARTLPIKSFHDLVCQLLNKPEFRKDGFLGLLGRIRAGSVSDGLLRAGSVSDGLLRAGSVSDGLLRAGSVSDGGPTSVQVGFGKQIVTLLEQLYRSADWPAFRHQLAVRSVLLLQDALDEYKKQHGLWSFQDMISRVDDALDPSRNPQAGRLATLLRRRFRCGIVDEFQDTDPVQWRILRRIFLAADEPAPTLFLVGDPKQAIFGFRGADLPTYQQAVQELLQRHQAQDCPLRVNWRSSPELIDGLNRLFHQGDWFPQESHIRYLPVEPAPEDERPSRLITDRTNRPALNVVDWRQDQLLSRLRRRHAQFMVREIGRLLAGDEHGPTMVSIKKGAPRPLHAGDICVLVFKRNEARTLLSDLRQAGIPYSFYKQAALWKSQEAVHLRYLLEALSQPEHRDAFRRALLTRFFRISPQDLAQSDELPGHHPARLLFEKWLDLAADRQWASLFQSMLEDTGLFFADLDDTDTDRRRANYRHLTTRLIQQAYQQNLDLVSLTDWYRRQVHLGVVDEDVQPKETERPRVQIMTIHASKGLEFPVVFLAGGWTQRQGENVLVYREGTASTPTQSASEGPPVQVFDVTNPPPDSPRRAAAESDKLDEQRRLLYVALTRAMFKLYVPYTLTDGTYWKSKGPIVQLLAPALDRVVGNESPGSLAVIDPILPLARRASEGPGLDVEDPSLARRANLSSGWHFDGPLMPSLDADLARRGVVIRSFTSLHRAGRAEEPTYVAEPPRAEDEDGANPRADAEDADPLRGAVFGEIVHGVLEKIDYQTVGQAASSALLLADRSATEKVLSGEIEHYLPQLVSRLPEDELRSLCRERVAQLVWNALHTPLPEIGPLWQIPRRDRLVEVAFHFPEHEMESSAVSQRREEGFLTGYIDLVLRRQGRYFLVDWKTNALAGYGPDELAQAMDESDYHLQYRLYLQALVRWLRRSLGPTFDWTRDLGGVYYLFLRGLGGAEGEGIFFYRPTRADLQLGLVLAPQSARK